MVIYILKVLNLAVKAFDVLIFSSKALYAMCSFFILKMKTFMCSMGRALIDCTESWLEMKTIFKICMHKKQLLRFVIKLSRIV